MRRGLFNPRVMFANYNPTMNPHKDDPFEFYYGILDEMDNKLFNFPGAQQSEFFKDDKGFIV